MRSSTTTDTNYMTFGKTVPRYVDCQYRTNAIHAARDFGYTEIVPNIIAQIRACKNNDQISTIMKNARMKKWNDM